MAIIPIYYDIEVFKDDSFVGVLYPKHGDGEYIYEQYPLHRFVQNFVKDYDSGYIYVGFNNFHFDNVVLQLYNKYYEIIRRKTLAYELSSLVIHGLDSPYVGILKEFIDCYQPDMTSKTRYIGKKVEHGFTSIVEKLDKVKLKNYLYFSTFRLNKNSYWIDMMENFVIPSKGSLKYSALKYFGFKWDDFDITSEEYNKSDLLATQKLYEKFGRKYATNFQITQDSLINKMGFSIDNPNNDTENYQDSVKVLHNLTHIISNHNLTKHIIKNIDHNKKFSFSKLYEIIGKSKSEYKNNLLSYLIDEEETPYHLLNLSITPNSGGVHSSLNNKIFKTDLEKKYYVYNVDFSSFYPNIYINLNLFDNTYNKKLKDIYYERMSIKDTNKTRAGAIKLLLNSIFGLLAFRTNNKDEKRLYSKSVTAVGQLILIELIEFLQKDILELVDVNTDGIIFTSNKQLKLSTFTPSFLDVEFPVDCIKLDVFYNKKANNYIKEINGKKSISGSWVSNSKTTGTDNLPTFENIIQDDYDADNISNEFLTLIGKYQNENEELPHFAYKYIPENYKKTSLDFTKPTISNIDNRYLLVDTCEHYTQSFKKELCLYIKECWLNSFKNTCFFKTKGKKYPLYKDYLYGTLEDLVKEVDESKTGEDSIKIDFAKTGIVAIDIDNKDNDVLNSILDTIKNNTHIIQESVNGYHVFVEYINITEMIGLPKVEYFMNEHVLFMLKQQLKIPENTDIRRKYIIKTKNVLRCYVRKSNMNIKGLQELVDQYPCNFIYKASEGIALTEDEFNLVSEVISESCIDVIINGDKIKDYPLNKLFILKDKKLYHNPKFFSHKKYPDSPIYIYNKNGYYQLVCYVCANQLSNKNSNQSDMFKEYIPEYKATYIDKLQHKINDRIKKII